MKHILMKSSLIFVLVSTAYITNAQEPPKKQFNNSQTIDNKNRIAIEAFAKIPFIEKASLSPNGKFIAGLVGINGSQRITMFPLRRDNGKTVTVAVPDGMQVNNIRWIGNDNITINLTVLQKVQDDDWYLSRVIALNRNTSKMTKLLWELNGQNTSDILWIPKDDSKEILMAGQDSIYSNRDNFWPTVYKVNVETGKKKVVLRGKSGVLNWGADNNGNIRLGVGYNDRLKTSHIFYAKEGSKNFKTIDRANLGKDETIKLPLSFVPGSDNGLMFKEDANGKTGIAEVNLLTQQITDWALSGENGDIESVLTSDKTGNIIGYKTSESGDKTLWLNPKLAASQEFLNKAARKASAQIIDYSDDFKLVLAKISTPDNPGLLFVHDTGTNAIAQLAPINDAIGNKRLSKVKMIDYKARDGLDIEGVLTMPKGRTATNLPLIVMPHGGPWAHDTVRYDYWAQFLANRGYVVLQPNFRGSTGYGKAFMLKGQGQMGLAMQDDISDAVSWAVEQGIADPKRVCIVGASYGGYAAMWGIVKDPDQYRCAISIAGVSHLRKEVNDFGNAIRKNLFQSQWKKMTPNFSAVSPIKAVDRIKVPLLLIHGQKDVTVGHKQSVLMEKEMRKAGKSVEMISLPLADHYFTREEDRLKLLQSMESFLEKHNPAY